MKISLVFDTVMFGEIGVNIQEQLRLVCVDIQRISHGRAKILFEY